MVLLNMNFSELHSALLGDFKKSAAELHPNQNQMAQNFALAAGFLAKDKGYSAEQAAIMTSNRLRQWATPFDRLPVKQDEPLAPDAMRSVKEIFEWAEKYSTPEAAPKQRNTSLAIVSGLVQMHLQPAEDIERPSAEVLPFVPRAYGS